MKITHVYMISSQCWLISDVEMIQIWGARKHTFSNLGGGGGAVAPLAPLVPLPMVISVGFVQATSEGLILFYS